MKAEKIVSLESVIAAVSAYAKAATTAENKGSALADDMVKLGIVPDAFYAPKKDASVSWKLTDDTEVTHAELYGRLKAAVVSSMSAAQQKLLALPKAAVAAHQKDPRLKAQQAISARMADLRKAVTRRLPKEEKVKEEKAAKPETETAKPETHAAAKIRIGERLIAAMKIAQADEAPDYKHRELIQALTDALTMLGMKMPEEE